MTVKARTAQNTGVQRLEPLLLFCSPRTPHSRLSLLRDLASPAVLKSAVLAACGSSAACFPRLRTHDRYPLWYLEAVMFLGSIMLWGFVFAWHTKYMKQPVFKKLELRAWTIATVLGLAAATLLGLSLDPALRAVIPSDYPANFEQWAG